MGLLDYLQQVYQNAGQNLDDENANLKQAIKDQYAKMDRINSGQEGMSDALNDTTPAQQNVMNQNANVAMGSLAPEGSAFNDITQRLAEDTPEVAKARFVADKTLDTGAPMNQVAQTQQQLSRAQDFADRARAQRFAKIKSILGR